MRPVRYLFLQAESQLLLINAAAILFNYSHSVPTGGGQQPLLLFCCCRPEAEDAKMTFNPHSVLLIPICGAAAIPQDGAREHGVAPPPPAVALTVLVSLLTAPEPKREPHRYKLFPKLRFPVKAEQWDAA